MSTLRKIIAGVLTVGLLAAAMWLYTFKPHIDAGLQNPIMVNGRVGAVVSNRVFSVKVGRVEVAKAISKPGFPNPVLIPSPGLFVVVQMEIKSNRKPFQPGHVRLVTRGDVSYQESGRTAILTSSDDYQPMLWAPSTFIFEIPKDRLTGARVVIGESAFLNQLSAETQVDLGLDASRAARPSPIYTLKSS